MSERAKPQLMSDGLISPLLAGGNFKSEQSLVWTDFTRVHSRCSLKLDASPKELFMY